MHFSTQFEPTRQCCVPCDLQQCVQTKKNTRNLRNILEIVGARTGSYPLEHTCKQMAAMQTIYNDLNKRTQARHEKTFNQVGSPS